MAESADQPDPSAPDPGPSAPDGGTSSARGGELPPVPWSLRLVAALVLVEAAVLAGVAVWSGVAVATGGSTALGVALFLIVFCLAVAAALVAAVRALRAGRRGGRAPIVTWQLLQAATGLTIANGVTGPVGAAAWVALAVAVLVAGLMMTRGVVEHTVPQARPTTG